MNRYRVERQPTYVDVDAETAEQALTIGVNQLRAKDAGPFTLRALVQVEQPHEEAYVFATIANLRTGALQVDAEQLRRMDLLVAQRRQP